MRAHGRPKPCGILGKCVAAAFHVENLKEKNTLGRKSFDRGWKSYNDRAVKLTEFQSIASRPWSAPRERAAVSPRDPSHPFSGIGARTRATGSHGKRNVLATRNPRTGVIEN